MSRTHAGAPDPRPWGPLIQRDRVLDSREIAFIERADRLAIAGPCIRAYPTLSEFNGPPGMLKVIDRTIVALSLGNEASAVPIGEGDACGGLVIATPTNESMQIAGAVRCLRSADAARVVRRALGLDRRSCDEIKVLLFDVQQSGTVARNECRVLDPTGGK